MKIDTHYQHVVQHIAKSPVVNYSVPTHFSTTLYVQRMLMDYAETLDDIIDTLLLDPIITARIIQQANIITLKDRTPCLGLCDSARLLGVDTVRRIALATALQQLAFAKVMLPFMDVGRSVWLNTVYRSCAAHVIAKRFTLFDPHLAYAQSLIGSCGAFYFIQQLSRYGLQGVMDEDIKASLAEHHFQLTRRFLDDINIPVQTTAFLDIESYLKKTVPGKLNSITDVLCVAFSLANQRFPCYIAPDYSYIEQDKAPEYFQCGDEIEKMYHELYPVHP